MKFTLLTTLLAGSAIAAPSLHKRDLATIQQAIGTVQTALEGLGTAVDAVNAQDPASATGILGASTKAQDAIKTATTQIQGSEALSLTDALSLQQTATGLTTAANTTVQSLIAKKPVFDQLGVSSVVATQLTDQKTAAGALGDAVVSKIPAIGQSIAQQSLGQINTVLDSAIQTYSAGGATGESFQHQGVSVLVN